MKKFAAISFALFIYTIMLISPCYVFAQDTEDYFSFTASKEDVLMNDEIRITVTANELGMNESIAGFRLNVEYDSSKLTLKRVDTSSQIESGTFRYHIAGDTMTGIYVCDGTAAPQLTGECMTLIFRVNDDAIFGETSVSAQIDQVVDWTAKQLPSVSSLTSVFRITPEFTKEAVLTKLVPSQGTLEPEFDPYIQEYSLQVGPEVEQILFELEAADGGTARVNRKNLGKQGSTTQFIITVTSSDKKNKSQYTVNVTRGEKIKEESNSKSSTSGRGKTSGLAKQTTEEGIDDETLHTDTIFYGDRNLYIVGNQMPSYFVYIIVGGLGVCMIGMVIIVLVVRKKKK